MVFPTVASLTTSDGRGNSSTTSYTYQGGLWSSSERRFLGFRYAKGVIDAAGTYTETYYHQHVGCISKPETTYVKDPTGKIYSYSTFTYNENSSPPVHLADDGALGVGVQPGLRRRDAGVRREHLPARW